MLCASVPIMGRTTPPPSSTTSGCSNMEYISPKITWGQYKISCKPFLAVGNHIQFLAREILMTSQIDDYMLYLCQKDVERACQELDSVAVIREVFRLHNAVQTILPD